MIGEFQTRLQEFIRRLRVDDDRLLAAERRVVALRQNIRDLWAFQGGGSGLCFTTLEGQVTGNTGVLPAGATIRFEGAVTGIDYGTTTATSGLFSVALIIDLADTSLNAYVGGFGSRFDETIPTNFTPTACATNTGLSFQGVPGSSYNWFNAVNLPINRTLNVTDNLYGAGTATDAGPVGTGNWQSCYQITSRATSGIPPCTAVATVLVHQLAGFTGALTILRAGVTCPTVTSNCSLASTVTATTAQTSLTAPTTSAPAFSVTFNANTGTSNNPIYPLGSTPVTLYE